jgi:hypothetical protein
LGVLGPASSGNGNIATFNGTSGVLIQDSGKAVPSGAIVGTSDVQTLTGSKNFTGGLQVGGNSLDGGWTSFTPLPSLASCLSGSLTAATSDGAYKIIGTKTIALRVHIAVTTAGTCNAPIITLPVTPNGSSAITGGANGSLGKALQATFSSGNPSAAIAAADGGNAAVTGAGLFLSGIYDSQ